MIYGHGMSLKMWHLRDLNKNYMKKPWKMLNSYSLSMFKWDIHEAMIWAESEFTDWMIAWYPHNESFVYRK